MHKGDKILFYKKADLYHGVIVHKKKEKIVFNTSYINRFDHEETLDFQILSPFSGIVMLQSKVYILDQHRKLAVIQAPSNQMQRRKDVRVDTNLVGEITKVVDIRLGTVADHLYKDTVIIQNLSQGGLCMISNSYFQVGTELSLKFSLFNQNITLNCKLIRVVKTEEKYNMGCTFNNINDQTSGLIGKFVLYTLRNEFLASPSTCLK